MFKLIRDLFKRHNADDMMKEQLREARIALANAEHQLEYYSATVPMLQMRVARLEAQTTASDGRYEPNRLRPVK